MAEPEQIYEEVLQEEQQKGSSSPVAEGRAKAARLRAEHGSPHPKEPKWWGGAQPHLDGAGPAAGGDEPAGEPAAEAEEAQPVAEAPEAQPAAEAKQEQPAAEAKQAQPAAEAKPAAGAEQEKPAAAAQKPPAAAAHATPGGTTQTAVAERPLRVTELPPEQRPGGVRHGTTTGTRMRPEDGVVSDAQLTGEAAVRERRRVIDELLATGVPAATAAEAGSPRGSPLLALMYIIIPVAAVLLLFGAYGNKEPAAPAAEEGGGGGVETVTAESTQFDTNEITLTAGEKTEIKFVNNDPLDHNIAIYEQEGGQGKQLFKGKIINDATTTYNIPPLDKGNYFFHCDVHPSMKGTVVVE